MALQTLLLKFDKICGNRPYWLFTFTQWPRFRANRLYSSFLRSTTEYNFVIGSKINKKQFRVGEYWNISTTHAKIRQHGNEAIGEKRIIGKVYWGFILGFHFAGKFPSIWSSLWGEGSVLLKYIMQSFQKFFVFIFCLIPSPCEDSNMQINCGNTGFISGAKDPKERRENACREETCFPNVQLSHIKRKFPRHSRIFHLLLTPYDCLVNRNWSQLILPKKKVHPHRNNKRCAIC